MADSARTNSDSGHGHRFRTFEHRSPGWYRPDQLLGQGGFAQVWKAKVIRPNLAPPKSHTESETWSTGDHVAVKLFKSRTLKDPTCVVLIENEVKILSSMDHPGIIRLYDVHQSHRGVHVVMEYAEGGTLHSLVRKKKLLWEPEVLPIFRQLTDALSYTHRKGIAHRDIKLENVMFTSSNQSNSVRLCDFGLAAQLSRSLVRPSDRQSTQISHVKSGEVSSDDYDCLKSECGSELYMAPEMQLRKFYDGRAVDVWSLGVLLYTTLTGHFPFMGSSAKELRRRVCKTEPPWAHYASRKVLKEALALRDLRNRIIEKHGSAYYAQLLHKHSWSKSQKERDYSNELYSTDAPTEHENSQRRRSQNKGSTSGNGNTSARPPKSKQGKQAQKDSTAPLKPVIPRKSTRSSTPGLHDTDDALNRNRYWVHLSLEALDLLLWMLEKTTKRRATILDVESHPFVLGRNLAARSMLESMYNVDGAQNLDDLSMGNSSNTVSREQGAMSNGKREGAAPTTKQEGASTNRKQVRMIRQPRSFGWNTKEHHEFRKPGLSLSVNSIAKADPSLLERVSNSPVKESVSKSERPSKEKKDNQPRYQAVPLSMSSRHNKSTGSLLGPRDRHIPTDSNKNEQQDDSSVAPESKQIFGTFEESLKSVEPSWFHDYTRAASTSPEARYLEQRDNEPIRSFVVSPSPYSEYGQEGEQTGSPNVNEVLITGKLELEGKSALSGEGGSQWPKLPPLQKGSRREGDETKKNETDEKNQKPENGEFTVVQENAELEINPVVSYSPTASPLQSERAREKKSYGSSAQRSLLKKLLSKPSNSAYYARGLQHSDDLQNGGVDQAETNTGATKNEEHQLTNSFSLSGSITRIHMDNEVDRTIATARTDRPESAGDFMFHARIPSASPASRQAFGSSNQVDEDGSQEVLENQQPGSSPAFIEAVPSSSTFGEEWLHPNDSFLHENDGESGSPRLREE